MNAERGWKPDHLRRSHRKMRRNPDDCQSAWKGNDGADHTTVKRRTDDAVGWHGSVKRDRSRQRCIAFQPGNPQVSTGVGILRGKIYFKKFVVNAFLTYFALPKNGVLFYWHYPKKSFDSGKSSVGRAIRTFNVWVLGFESQRDHIIRSSLQVIRFEGFFISQNFAY